MSNNCSSERCSKPRPSAHHLTLRNKAPSSGRQALRGNYNPVGELDGEAKGASIVAATGIAARMSVGDAVARWKENPSGAP
jgi:hypothetical protein